MKVAILYYGQLRTGLYCLPWHQEMIAACGPDTKVFVDLQTENHYANVRGVSSSYSSEEQLGLFTSCLPGLQAYSFDDQAQALDPKQGHWHYARLIRSLFRVNSLYSAWAALHGDVDAVVLMRADALVGPSVRSLSKQLQALEPLTFMSDSGPFMFTSHEYGLGVGDLCMAGTPEVISSVISSMSSCLFYAPRRSWRSYPFGPNILIYKTVGRLGFKYKNLHIKVALVRPTAEAPPVMESFNYHLEFWTANHKGM